MPVSETLQVLDALSKRRLSKRERKERARTNLDAFIRKPGQPAQPAQPLQQVRQKEIPLKNRRQLKAKASTGKAGKLDTQALREKNAATMRAADRLVTARCQDLHRSILELMRARKERRQPKLKQKKRLTYFDFEDADS
ncbi:hypothetical protein LPJ61_004604 [Coemansia biformis]|uniref:Uncharacterized protein n=1 Tax=Coemansia biformis TaxID=1286918 RepID=A0A9W8CUI9_9FUNG|nr:hypothetical protein LPJ61_004604 [Coemansia biformis]